MSVKNQIDRVVIHTVEQRVPPNASTPRWYLDIEFDGRRAQFFLHGNGRPTGYHAVAAAAANEGLLLPDLSYSDYVRRHWWPKVAAARGGAQ